MKKIQNLELLSKEDVTVFNRNFKEGVSLSCEFPEQITIATRTFSYENEKGEQKEMTVALVPVVLETGEIQSITVNSTLKFVLESGNVNGEYVVTAVATKDPRFTRLEFGMLTE